MTRHDPTCAELANLSGLYLEDLLPGDLCESLEQHLLVCDPCVVQLGRMLTVRRRLGQLPRRSAPDGLVAAIAGRMHDEPGR